MKFVRTFHAAAACLLLSLTAISVPAAAVNLSVSHWGEGMYGVPFAVALEKGYFKA